MSGLPKRILGMRIPRKLKKKHGIALLGAGITAILLAGRKRAASFIS